MSFYSKLLNHSFVMFSSLALLVSLAFSANAEETQTEKSPIEKVFQTQVNSYYSINGFYNFSANQGAQKDLDDINDALAVIEERMNELRSESGKASDTDSFKTTTSAWQAYKKILNQNIREVKKTGYPDLRLAGDMAKQNIAFNAALADFYDTMIEMSDRKPNNITALSRNAATNLALMMTKYSARTTSTVSQVYAGEDGDLEVTIDSLATEFSKQLHELLTSAKDNKVAYKLLDSANTKWDFIKSSYLNYNENRVNFIVNLYSKKIISDIDLALAKK